jgi:hypothetical protein
VPGLAEEEVPDLQNALDVAGLTYSGSVALDGDDTITPYPPGVPQPWLEGLGIVIRRLAEELPDRPVAVAGLPVPRDVKERAEMVPTARAVLDEARADGIDVSMLIIDAGSAYADVEWTGPS